MSSFQLTWLSGHLLSCLARRPSTVFRQCRGCRLLYTNSQQEEAIKQERVKRHPSKRQEQNKKFTKFHRVLTEDEIQIEENFKQINISDESDTFGHLSQPLMKSPTLANEKFRKFDAGRKEPSVFVKSGRSEESRSNVDYKDRYPRKQVSNNSNTFGTLSEVEAIGDESLHTEIGSHNERFSDDKDGDPGDHIRLSTYNRRHSQDWYGRQIEKFGGQGRVKEAVAVLEEWMLKRDRVMPSAYTFTALIGVLGRVGYTKKAFNLFNKMKKMGLEPVDLTYTSLFNACANSPWRQDGLSRADKLRSLMQHKGYKPNLITYHAMIKAHAMHGDLRTAFTIMDELLERFQPTAETFSFLLMACIADKKAGFKHAVEVWRLLRKFKVTPDMFLYNLLLRTVRECGAGDASFANQLLGRKQEPQKIPISSGHEREIVQESLHIISDKAIKSANSESSNNSARLSEPGAEADAGVSEWWKETQSVEDSYLPSLIGQNETLPNLLDPDCDLSQVVSVGELKRTDERLAVIGGVAGILDSMTCDGASPDVRTFTQLVEVAPPTNDAEMALFAKMKSLGVKPDIAFFNTVIHRRCFRRDAEAARAVLRLISGAGLFPDIRTFGCLAMTCRNKRDGMKLLEDMNQSGMAPNIEILGTLAFASNLDFGYKLAILQEVENLDMRPNDKFIEVLERSISNAKEKIVEVEKGNRFDEFISSEYFKSTFGEFMIYYKAWLHKTLPEDRVHPWQAFRPQTEDESVTDKN